MKNCSAILIAALLLASLHAGFAQGFINLNFEQAQLSGLVTNSYGVSGAAVSRGWTAYFDSDSTTNLRYNAISLGGPVVSLEGTNYVGAFPPIQGKYYMLLFGGLGSYSSASVGQTGTIPASAQSLIFWGSGCDVSFNSQSLSLLLLGNTNGYGIWGADISGLAGQTGQLLFTAENGITFNRPTMPGYYPGQWVFLDNIQFSSTAVPEPETLVLAVLGASLLGFRRQRQENFL